MKSLFLSIGLLALGATSATAQDTETYLFRDDLPEFVEQMQAELTYPLAWGNSDIKDFDQWRAAARNQLRYEMLLPPPAAKSYDMRVIATERRKGYTAKKIAFNLTAYSRVEAYLLVPDGKAPHPAILLQHDHGGHYSIGKEKMIRPFGVTKEVADDAEQWLDKCYGGQFMGDYLASQGFVVLSHDAPFWGSRGAKEGTKGQDYRYAAGHFFLMGRNLGAWMIFEDAMAADFLSQLPEVDAARVACTGHSMGGYRAWMTAALTDRVKAAAPVCWMTTTAAQVSREYGLKKHEEWPNLVPGIRRYLDYPHIASIACPKPMLFVNGDSDKLFPVPAVESAYATMHAVWDSQHVGDRLETHLLHQPHYCGPEVQKMVADFFKKHL